MSPILKKYAMLAAPCAAMLNRAVRPAARNILNGPPAKFFSTVSADVSNELEQIAKKYLSEISEKDLKKYVANFKTEGAKWSRERLVNFHPEKVARWEWDGRQSKWTPDVVVTTEDCIGIAIEASRRIHIPQMQQEKGN